MTSLNRDHSIYQINGVNIPPGHHFARLVDKLMFEHGRYNGTLLVFEVIHGPHTGERVCSQHWNSDKGDAHWKIELRRQFFVRNVQDINVDEHRDVDYRIFVATTTFRYRLHRVEHIDRGRLRITKDGRAGFAMMPGY